MCPPPGRHRQWVALVVHDCIYRHAELDEPILYSAAALANTVDPVGIRSDMEAHFGSGGPLAALNVRHYDNGNLFVSDLMAVCLMQPLPRGGVIFHDRAAAGWVMTHAGCRLVASDPPCAPSPPAGLFAVEALQAMGLVLEQLGWRIATDEVVARFFD